ncbi:efflux RND transporter periplasmic adaptor subunit [Gluconobacter morbifer]|nr:efflux RND transporter periplasmic adaptor subunit [Gluconobacter morbifer]
MRISRVGILVIGLSCAAALSVLVLKYHAAHTPVPAVEPPMFAVENGSIVLRSGAPLEKRLIVTPVSRKLGAQDVTLPGQVMAEPDHQLNILSPVTGRVLSVNVRLGQKVHRGQLLITVAAGDLAQAWADDRRARATLDFARRAYTRAKGVQTIGGNAVKDLESARNDLAQAEAEADRTQRRLQSLGARPGYSAQGEVPLVSPVDGVVGAVNTAPSQNVTDATAVLMTVLDLSEVWIAAALPENRLAQLQPDNTLFATFRTLPDKTCSGPITTRDAALHSDTRRLNLYLACPNPDGLLRPGMYADVNLNVPDPDTIVVPKTALLMNNDQVSVFVETTPRTFRRRYINISYDEGDNVRVLSGLSAGERIVTTGAVLLNDD